MYSREERTKAIELYIKYDRCAADVARELGYPDRKSLVSWYEAYLEEQETGVLWEECSRYAKYSSEERATAVEHYLEHGRNLSRTARAPGYPSRDTLRAWCDELAPRTRKKRTGGIHYTQEQKREAVIALCTRTGRRKDIAKEYGVTPEALYNWKNDLLSKEDSIAMPREDEPLPDERHPLIRNRNPKTRYQKAKA